MGKRVAILQSDYIPWKGYFDIIHDVDEVIFLDEAQYTRQDWRNRNRIKTPAGPRWLTLPVGTSVRRRICDVLLPDRPWGLDHWRRIEASYATAPFFRAYSPFFEEIYLTRHWQFLSELNQHLIRAIAAQLLGANTSFLDSREFDVRLRGSDRVIEILRRTGAAVYVSGRAAKSYLDVGALAQEGIELIWKDYEGYPVYDQLHPPFRHDVTILDLLFHTGSAAPHYIWGWRS